MSTDLLSQLGEYGADHEERQEAVTVEDILGTVVPLPVRTTRTFSPRSVMVALAAAAVVALVLALPLLFALGDSPPSESSTVPSTPTTTIPDAISTTTVSTPSTLPPDATSPVGEPEYARDIETGLMPAEAAGWMWTPIDEAERGRQYLLKSGAIVRFNRGWNCLQDGKFYAESENVPNAAPICSGLIEQPMPTVEISDDGLTWRSATLPPAPASWVMGAETAGGAGYAYVLFFDGAREWRWYGTTNGVEWFEALDDWIPLRPDRAIPTDSGAIAVSGYYEQGTRSVSYSVSVDGGRTYRDDVMPPAIADHPAVLGSADGAVEALVWSETEDDGVAHSDPVLWRSLDGAEWTEVGVAAGLPTLDTERDLVGGQQPGEIYQPSPRAGTIEEMSYVMWQLDNGTRIIGVTFGDGDWYTTEDNGQLFMSDDGLTWTPMTALESVSPDPDLAMVDGWLIASGELTTNDGSTWYRLIGPGGKHFDSHSADGAGVVAYGWNDVYTTDPSMSDDGAPVLAGHEVDEDGYFRGVPPR